LKSLNNHFTYVDYGEKANKFLQSCGARKRPSSIDIAELLVKSSSEIWNSIKSNEKYLIILNHIATNYREIVNNKPGLVQSMKKAPILAAVKFDGEEANYRLTSAKEIFTNDDIIYQQVFNPLTAPIGYNLKVLYKVC
jgi:hypothetical protein